jgi:hypothetical protein
MEIADVLASWIGKIYASLKNGRFTIHHSFNFQNMAFHNNVHL